MMPGMRGMSPKQMEQMMKRMGMREIDAEKVIIRTKEGKIIIRQPSVSVIEVQGKRTYTIVGDDKMVKGKSKVGAEGPAKDETEEEVEEKGEEEEVKEKADAPIADAGPRFTDEDVRLVAEQAGVSEEKARKALEECDGAPAEAIVKLMGG